MIILNLTKLYLAIYTNEEIRIQREELISQGIIIPNVENEYYNHDDESDRFSCATGDYRASNFTDAGSTIIDIGDDTLSSGTTTNSDTLYDGSDAISQLSTPTGTSTGQEPVYYEPIGVNDAHEGMAYDLLLDGPGDYDFEETSVQKGNFTIKSTFIIDKDLPSILAPEWLLFIFPRPDPEDTSQDRHKWEDFHQEMKRTRKLIELVPESDPKRLLGQRTNPMTSAEKDEFRRLGNDLLVIITVKILESNIFFRIVLPTTID